MSNENVTAHLTLALELLIFFARISVCALNQRNVITVTEPAKGNIWISGQTSYPITWTQSKFSFKWNIVLLDKDQNKVVDISTGLSEFNEAKMIHNWLVPQSVQTGNYKIKICASASPDDCGSSDPFSIQNSEDAVQLVEIDSHAFSPVQNPQERFAQTNATNKRKSDPDLPQPHELLRRKRLERERLYFKRMTDQIKEQRDGECTIERVHQPSKETFVERYMKNSTPAILTGMVDTWEAMRSWDFTKLGKVLTKGVNVEIMEGLTPYALWNDYRSRYSDMYKEPSKVVMDNFEQIYPELLHDVSFPKFYQDYMEVVDEDIRPPQLSLELAPKRAGHHWRVQALNASVWSALVLGRKRWGLYPPSQYFVPGVVHNDHQTQDSQQSESFTWWTYTRPHLLEGYKPLEYVQEPGDILYIPSGWWWNNINIDDSIAVQKAVCDETSIQACMNELKELADSAGDNFHGDVFIQLRHYLEKHNPGLLADDDRQFKSPIRGLGTSISDLGHQHHEDVWKKYFLERNEAAVEDPVRNQQNT